MCKYCAATVVITAAAHIVLYVLTLPLCSLSLLTTTPSAIDISRHRTRPTTIIYLATVAAAAASATPPIKNTTINISHLVMSSGLTTTTTYERATIAFAVPVTFAVAVSVAVAGVVVVVIIIAVDRRRTPI